MLLVALWVVVMLLGSGSSAQADDPLAQQLTCKAAIAAIMSRDPAIIKVEGQAGGTFHLSYVRNDNTRWAYRCKVVGTQVIWATETGRWRDHPQDERVFYEAIAGGTGVKIIQRWGDGSKAERTYSREQLQ